MGKFKWKRAAMLDWLQLDLFVHLFRKYRPDFSTFFSNTTAHYQHCYWRNMDPSLFSIKPTEEEQAQYKGAVLFGYQQMDLMLERLFRFEREDAILVLCSALGQQPYLVREDEGGKQGYRPYDLQQFLSHLGMEGVREIYPVMAEQFYVDFQTHEQAAKARAALATLEVGDNRLLQIEQHDNSLYLGCGIFSSLDESAIISGRINGSTVAYPFYRVFYKLESLKSGYHHPDGILWIKGGVHKVHKGKVSLTDIGPTILNFFGLPIPDYMDGKIVTDIVKA